MANCITRHIPNALTSCNLISGCIATGAAFSGHYEGALLFIVIGAVFDFFDGMSARLLHVSSEIGKELDSLADDVTFGVAPATMVYTVCSSCYGLEERGAIASYLPYLAFIMAAFSAIRLAKFNLDTRQATSFIGLPTPANALFWASLIVGNYHEFMLNTARPWSLILLAGTFVSSYLLVSEIPMFALKFKNLSWKENKIKYIFVLTSLLMLALWGITGIAAIIVWYIILSLFTRNTSSK